MSAFIAPLNFEIQFNFHLNFKNKKIGPIKRADKVSPRQGGMPLVLHGGTGKHNT